jgi:hypothetical protein
MHLAAISLGNVIHLGQNKLLVSCLFAVKKQPFDKLHKFGRHHRPVIATRSFNEVQKTTQERDRGSNITEGFQIRKAAHTDGFPLPA